MKKKKAIVIGSGVSGLAASIRLSVKGYDVIVFEVNSYPGGKLTQLKLGAYRFDAGPSLFTMPEYLEELFQLAGKNLNDYFQYKKEDESGRYFWDDGTRLLAHADAELFATETEKVLGTEAALVLKRLRKSEKMYELAGKIFLEKPLNKLSTWFNRDVGKAILHLPELGVFDSMHSENQRLLNHPKLVQLFDRYATYNGSDPYRAPGTLNIIPHLEHNLGTYHPSKGMHEITESLMALATELGVVFHFEEKVEKINVVNGNATGVSTLKGEYLADIVISDMDIMLTYRKLLADQPAPERILKQERSSSALIFYWGIKRVFPELGLHNVFFSKDYRSEFDDLFKGVVPAADPTVYVNISAKNIPGDAPESCENWFVMLNVPPHRHHNWQELIPQYRQAIINKLNPILAVDLESLIEVESTLSPEDIQLKTSSFGGSLYGNSSNNKFAAFLRHTNNSSRIRNLFFCGGSVHPGGGIPLCLLSAKIVSQLCPNP